MPQLLIDTDSESVETLRDTIQLLAAICARREKRALTPVALVPVEPKPDELLPSVVFAANPPVEDPRQIPPDDARLTAAAPLPAPEKPKRTRKPRGAAAAPVPATTPVPLPPVLAEAPYKPTVTPAIAARIAEAGAPPPPPPAPLTLVGEAPATAPGPTFRDVMLVITQGLSSGKLTNAEVTEVCKRQGISGPTELPAQPMLNGPILAGLNKLLATKG